MYNISSLLPISGYSNRSVEKTGKLHYQASKQAR